MKPYVRVDVVSWKLHEHQQTFQLPGAIYDSLITCKTFVSAPGRREDRAMDYITSVSARSSPSVPWSVLFSPPPMCPNLYFKLLPPTKIEIPGWKTRDNMLFFGGQKHVRIPSCDLLALFGHRGQNPWLPGNIQAYSWMISG